jgi:DNA mismatch endonuclease (patch repair protein)
MAAREYKRDKRSPTPKNEAVSRSMSGNKGKNTKPEMLLRKALWRSNIRGYRIHNKTTVGRPDLAFCRKRIAIFVHGCFWHRCPKCQYSLPKHNSEYWKAKFSRNVERDRRNFEILQQAGWNPLIIWECQIKENIDHVVDVVKRALEL